MMVLTNSIVLASKVSISSFLHRVPLAWGVIPWAGMVLVAAILVAADSI
jgi:hypothetical protein